MVNFNKKLPDDYKHLMNQPAYELMIDTIIQYFDEKGEPVLTVEDGYIITKADDDEKNHQRYGLDNLVRVVAAVEEEDREAVIYNHFNRAFYDARAMEYFKTDYDMAKQYLKILVKPLEILKQTGGLDVVYKTVLPGTCSVLVFDYDNKFTYLYYSTVKEWGKTNDELFDVALGNISGEDIEVAGVGLSKKEEGAGGDGEDENEEGANPGNYDIFLFMNPDFAAPAVCLMEQKAAFAIGALGSVVAIPSKGFAIAAPIHDASILDKLAPLSALVVKIFNEQPGPITTDFYWYYNGVFQLLLERTTIENEAQAALTLPKQLIQLLKEQ